MISEIRYYENEEGLVVQELRSTVTEDVTYRGTGNLNFKNGIRHPIKFEIIADDLGQAFANYKAAAKLESDKQLALIQQEAIRDALKAPAQKKAMKPLPFKIYEG